MDKTTIVALALMTGVGGCTGRHAAPPIPHRASAEKIEMIGKNAPAAPAPSPKDTSTDTETAQVPEVVDAPRAPEEPRASSPPPKTGPTIAELTDIIQVSVGPAHTCALTRNGEIYCWGANASGQLGIGERSDCRRRPALIQGIADAVEVAAGGAHTCARRRDGQVLCWGDNEFGQVGDGTDEDRLVPVVVAGLPKIRRLAVATAATCALSGTAALYCWGYPTGAFDEERLNRRPHRIKGRRGPVTDLAIGDDHLCLLKRDGTVRCRGDNAAGQIGGPDNGPTAKFKTVRHLSNGRQLVSGDNHNCVLTTSGTVTCWGDNLLQAVRPGAEGSVFRRPMSVPGVGDIRQLAAAASHTCALDRTGAVTCWGSTYGLQLGFDLEHLDAVSPLVRIPDIENAVQLATGHSHTCVVLTDGGLRCWGGNDWGQQGDGTATENECSTRDPLPDNFGLREGDTSRSGLTVIWE